GLSSFAFAVAPPKVCVWATCGAGGVGSGTFGAFAAGASGSVPGSIREEASNSCPGAAGYPHLASRRDLRSSRTQATCSASVCTCSSRAFIRASGADALPVSGGESLAPLAGGSCAEVIEVQNRTADKTAIFFMTCPREYRKVRTAVTAGLETQEVSA